MNEDQCAAKSPGEPQRDILVTVTMVIRRSMNVPASQALTDARNYVETIESFQGVSQVRVHEVVISR